MPLARASFAEDATALISRALLAPSLAAEAVLCPLTGLAAWLVWRRIDVGLDRKRAALRRWGWVLMLSALWPAALHGAHDPALAFMVLLLCLAAIAWTTLSFRRLQPRAFLLMLPYAAWIGVMAAIATLRFWNGAI